MHIRVCVNPIPEYDACLVLDEVVLQVTPSIVSRIDIKTVHLILLLKVIFHKSGDVKWSPQKVRVSQNIGQISRVSKSRFFTKSLKTKEISEKASQAHKHLPCLGVSP